MGRPKGVKNGEGKTNHACFYCEGTKTHWGKLCGACDGTGSDTVRKKLSKAYNK